MNLPKNYSEFLKSTQGKSPPKDWPETLISLWHDVKGNWATAHELVDGSHRANANWVHAYLHRKEGDEWNAGYWYRQAGRPFPKISLEKEHEEIVEFILNQ